MADLEAKTIKCPFYLERQKDKYRIKCEGPVKRCTTQLTFTGNKKWYIEKYCCNEFKLCRVYQMLCAKYDKKQ